ncbi:MAG: type II toxin-antitoxin system VapC family toxin [Blastocatellia bacterium]|nr:type II toxin-antitoxin system VapC family toxin [Blastocatellia bacterium]
MAIYYADSSVLVKRHVNETGSAWFRVLVDPSAGNEIITSRVSLVEVYSALNRRARESLLSKEDYRQIADDFAAISSAEYALMEFTEAVAERSRLLLERHTLRAYDAIQLASASLADGALQASGLPSLTFLAADDRLLNAATAEGILVDNPNIHP